MLLSLIYVLNLNSAILWRGNDCVKQRIQMEKSPGYSRTCSTARCVRKRRIVCRAQTLNIVSEYDKWNLFVIVMLCALAVCGNWQCWCCWICPFCHTSIPFRNLTISVDGNKYSQFSLFACSFVRSLHLYLHLVTWSSSGYRNANFFIFIFLHSIQLKKKFIFVRVDFSFCSVEHRQKSEEHGVFFSSLLSEIYTIRLNIFFLDLFTSNLSTSNQRHSLSLSLVT